MAQRLAPSNRGVVRSRLKAAGGCTCGGGWKALGGLVPWCDLGRRAMGKGGLSLSRPRQLRHLSVGRAPCSTRGEPSLSPRRLKAPARLGERVGSSSRGAPARARSDAAPRTAGRGGACCEGSVGRVGWIERSAGCGFAVCSSARADPVGRSGVSLAAGASGADAAFLVRRLVSSVDRCARRSHHAAHSPPPPFLIFDTCCGAAWPRGPPSPLVLAAGAALRGCAARPRPRPASGKAGVLL